MIEKLKILMIDDHPMIIEGYQNTLLFTKKENQELEIDIANNCDEAIMYMDQAVEKNSPYNVLFVDISIPPSKDGIMSSGEDLAEYARKVLPKAKIIILTMFNESFRIHNIIKTIDPEGFLIKSDLTSSELASAFQAVIYNPPFYSGTVNNHIRKSIVSDIVIDDKNRKILHLLSQGVKTKNLASHLDISLSAVEKRKRQLRDIFDVQDGQDETLLNEARKKGFV
ncbi:response regulator [Algibacter lectus]|uniref:DNA-binding NarL/FixJ family response regulator n=1 Tax=Algibacter lectus TaxID=221126 RepID=A0A090WPV2_9FLAO|nr:response regulator [Algibacter lectus]MDO7137762.1 response regulator [Algibacter lectus]MWW26268.1 response regulator [Algibacter lectus]TDY60255.1 DNA-binding NarL/FixJ family response regulator [Algibacter lectus]GAL62576.1 two-component response regulator of nitrate reduction [Algibacter lectus]GAL79006.1 two-component response regulator of nitrate reduction [Algibacter lectus]